MEMKESRVASFVDRLRHRHCAPSPVARCASRSCHHPSKRSCASVPAPARSRHQPTAPIPLSPLATSAHPATAIGHTAYLDPVGRATCARPAVIFLFFTSFCS
uniref:Uncharacterized protein n=1 Tax=Oryza sativa subsp. japonica TaxID=39947 RepID=Q84Q34_ORYSJ|nr:hypothetical protein [Oryza sativa Japonica Group]